jgi:branched-chain amino acid transport system substrate-binding protein
MSQGMTRTFALAPAALAAALVLGATAALAGTIRAAADPGVTATSILLGTTTPLSGPNTSASAITVGASAYLRYVNARGGVQGRQIALKVLDDAGNAASTVQLTRQLVDQDKVFAIVNAVGTEQNLAVRDDLNARKVPQLFAASGSTALGADPARYPYTLGFQPTNRAEGWVYGKYVARTQGAARVAVLFQDDDQGKDLLHGLEKGLDRSKAKIVAAQPYSPSALDVQAEVARLRASGATVLAVFGVGRIPGQAYAAASRLGWKPKLVLANMLASPSSVMTWATGIGAQKLVNATVSGVYLKDPNDPKWAKDAGLAQYRRIMQRYAPRADASDVSHVHGMAVAFTLVAALEKAGRNLTREGLMKAVERLNVTGNPFLVPGISVKTGVGDRSPIDQLLLQRWHKGGWKSFGGLWGYRGG